MTETTTPARSALDFTGRNPDVLSCIANLSNDEVSTPPEFANRMLDNLEAAWAAGHSGESIWADPNVKFLDPFTKSGVFLREITKRLVDGLADTIPDLAERVDHVLTTQVYGIAITELTSLIARRSVYCSKWANGKHSIATSFGGPDGNIWFERIEHTWVGGTKVLTADSDGNQVEVTKGGKCKYCGSPQAALDRAGDLESHAYAFIHTDDIKARIVELFGDDMQFDVIIGNPPYQLEDGGFGTSAAPIYQRFVEQAKLLEPRLLTMVIPSRWFAGGKGLEDFRESMLNDDRIRSIDDFLSASDVFPQIGLKGGVCYFLWDRDNPGECRVTTRFKDWDPSTATRPLLEDGADVFVRFNEGLSILKKVVAAEGSASGSISLPDGRGFDALVSSRKPFGLETTFQAKATRGANDVVVHQNGGTGYLARSKVPSGSDLIDHWKVYIGRAAPGTGNKDTYPHRILSTPFIGQPGSVSTETYLCIGPSPRRRRQRASCRTCRAGCRGCWCCSGSRLRTRPGRSTGSCRSRPRTGSGPTKSSTRSTGSAMTRSSSSSRSCAQWNSTRRTRMPRPLDDILVPKQPGRLRIYAYEIHDDAHAGLLKVGQTTQDVKKRVAQQTKTAAIKNYTIVLDESAEADDGTLFSDHAVRKRLIAKGHENTELEWMRCTVGDVQTAISELRSGATYSGTHEATFPMRDEQSAAVERTAEYFESIWAEDPGRVPRFLWNAKMRFGKTFAAYQLAKRLGVLKVLVVTFKPAVEDAWQSDLESHADFDGWQYLSKANGDDPSTADTSKPLVYFGSFQDLLGRKNGQIKAKNEWLHTTNWDLVIFDEYHFGAWRDSAKELFEGEDPVDAKKEIEAEFAGALGDFEEGLSDLSGEESDFLPITTRAYLYLSGTPFKALATGDFIEEQIFNWTYTDEQRAKAKFAAENPDEWNPYGALPEMRLFTYQMPDELISVAHGGEFDEFDLNAFFKATGIGSAATFEHKDDVQKWLDIIRGEHLPTQIDAMKMGSRPPFPYSDVRLRPYLEHSFWFLPTVAACHAMANLLGEKQNQKFWGQYDTLVVAGTGAGIGLAALPPVRGAIGSGFATKTITLSCGKLTTGVTVPQWSSILMLRNLSSPETYFQAAFRIQSPWSIRNPNGDDPHEEQVVKPAAFVFDFAPTRALRQLADYGIGLAPEASNPERAVEELVNFLPVLAYNGSHMTQVDAGGILDIAMSGTSATLLARKWESAILVNVDNDTLRKIMSNEAAMAAIMNIEGFRALGSDVFETVVNKSEKVKDTKKKNKDKELDPKKRKELTEEEREYRSKRKQIQEKLIKFATRIPAFMYLTDYRENTLQDVITKLEPGLFKTVTGLTVEDFNLLVSLGVFNATHMNQAVFAFRRYEDASLSYTGIESHEGLRSYGLYDTVIAIEHDAVVAP